MGIITNESDILRSTATNNATKQTERTHWTFVITYFRFVDAMDKICIECKANWEATLGQIKSCQPEETAEYSPVRIPFFECVFFRCWRNFRMILGQMHSAILWNVLTFFKLLLLSRTMACNAANRTSNEEKNGNSSAIDSQAIATVRMSN